MSLSSRGNPLYPTFSIEEYQRNPEAIKRVNDSALGFLEKLRMAVEENDKLLREKDEQIAQLQQLSLMDLLQPLFFLIGSIIFGFGVNLATSSPHEWYGWVLSFAGCAVQLIIIFISLWMKLRK